VEEPQDVQEREGGVAPEEGEEGRSEPQEPPEDTILSEPASVFDDLAELQHGQRKDDTKVIDLIPGRFRGKLAVRVKRIDPKKRKKKVRKAMKRGVTDEAEIQYAAELIAEATDAILYRPDGSDDLIEPQTLTAEFGDEPVRWDQRLGKMLKMDTLTGKESEAAIVRLVFRNPEALDAFFQELDLWLKEAIPDDDDEDEERENPL